MLRFSSLLFLCLLASADDRVKVDNEFVRILKMIDLPHNKSAMHQHDYNRVMMYLNAGDLTVTYEDGRVDRQHWKANQVAWSPAGGRHVSENVGKSDLRIVEVELKKPAPANPAKRDPKLDPVAIDPKHNILLLENSQVRVFRSWREAGATEAMHEHLGAGRIVVLLSDIKASVSGPDGKVTETKGAAGDVFWTAGAVKHAGKNAGTSKFDMLLVEVK